MAILALIVTSLVMNIIRKARVAAEKRSVDVYERSIELANGSYLLDNGKFSTDVSQLTIEYSGDTVTCETTQINQDSSVYLTECTVAGRTIDYAYDEDKVPSGLQEVRLIKVDEIETEPKEIDCCGGCGSCITTANVAKYDWMYNSNYLYWTMSLDTNSTYYVWYVNSDGLLDKYDVYDSRIVVRTVVVLSKSVL